MVNLIMLGQAKGGANGFFSFSLGDFLYGKYPFGPSLWGYDKKVHIL
jgi:hypothetical protein